MSIRALNKSIIVSSALTGQIILTLDFTDFTENSFASGYLMEKISSYINNEEGVLIKIGNKS